MNRFDPATSTIEKQGSKRSTRNSSARMPESKTRPGGFRGWANEGKRIEEELEAAQSGVDLESRFRARAASGSPGAGLRLLEDLDRRKSTTNDDSEPFEAA